MSANVKVDRSAPNVLIMAGGTGGHIFPGLAVADQFLSNGINVRWLGARGGMECRQVPAHGLAIDEINISGVRRKGLIAWLALPFRLGKAVWEARASMKRNQPVCALSFGGYAAGPGGIAAWLKGVPLVVHEQNQVAGMTNRVLARMARRVLQAFPNTFPEHLDALTCGNPVRASVTGLPDPALRFTLRTGRPRLLVTGGSQGAQSLNESVPAALKLLPEDTRPLVCHQSGVSGLEDTRRAYAEVGIDADVYEFIEDIAEAYAWADLVVCRAGALTVSELAVAGLGAILVPYPHAVDDHQTRNAAYLADAGAAEIMQEKDMDPVKLAACLEPLLSDRPRMLEMAANGRSVAISDAAQQVVDACEAWVKP